MESCEDHSYLGFINTSVTYQDKIVIITGGTKGIGEGCVRVFVDAGASVVFCARKQDEGDALTAELNALGKGEATFIKCDVSKTEEIENLIDKTVEKYGRIDCLINNAGWHPPHKTIDRFFDRGISRSARPESRQHICSMQICVAFFKENKGQHHQYVEPRRDDGAGRSDNLCRDEKRHHGVYESPGR